MAGSVSRKDYGEGQGLVEYAFILVLVAIVVIAVLLILGPNIGNVFTKVNSSLAAQSDGQSTTVPPTWTTCAVENGFCSFSGTALVKYGANSTWVTGTFTNGVPCNNSVFGDPLYGVVKSCQVYQ